MLQFLPKSLWRPLSRQEALPAEDGQVISVTDTICPISSIEGDARKVLRHVVWPAEQFQATCHHPSAKREFSIVGDLAIRYPSPLPRGNAVLDQVHLDWHIARMAPGHPPVGPAMLILDILQGGPLLAGYVAKTFAKNGIHAFVMHMPQNGLRKTASESFNWNEFLPNLRQAAADVRRARDVVATLPLVSGPIGLQGTSLGGFVATLAASIDNVFDPVLLALTGADIYGVLSTGSMDAARVRRHLRDNGFDNQRLADWLLTVEPLRVAHRLNPKRTWLFSARHDQVVRPVYGKK